MAGMEIDPELINVSSNSPSAESISALKVGISKICEESVKIRNRMTSALGKTSFDEVITSQLIGKGSTKISKEFLADSVITLNRLIESITPVANDSPNITFSTSTTDPSTDFNQFLDCIQTKLDSYTETMQSHQERFEQMFSSIQGLVSSSSNLIPSVSNPGVFVTPNTESPHLGEELPPCEPFVKFVEDAVPESIQNSLKMFLSENSNQFVNIGGCRDTLYFGEYGYKYNGGRHVAKEIPTPIKELLNVVQPHLSNTNANINSCLVTRYKSEADFIPQHRDDEPLLDPCSEIVTVSTGASRVLTFASNSGSKSQNLVLSSNSVLVTSRRAQDYWTHGIEKANEACEERVSFTFRHIAPHFLNSTVIVGDSNTRLLSFGDGKGNFGKWMPGECIKATHIEDIPDPIKIGPYRNVVIHTGINNIKTRNSRSTQGLGSILENKCKNIMKAYPNCKIFLSLLLPTKLGSLNYRVRDMNNILHDIAHTHKNISVINQHVDKLCDSNGLLMDEFGRYDREAGTFLARDVLHLGKKGLRLFAMSIKSSIMGKYKKQDQGQPTTSAERGTQNGYQPG